MGASKTYVLFIIFQLTSLISAQEVVKRVPHGFVGMRGKKYTETESAESDRFFKRKPQFFVGVKGKKSLYSDFEQDIYDYKRAPMGFVGMRGKKDFYLDDGNYYQENYDFPKTAGSLVGQIDYTTNEELKNSDSSMVNAFLSEYLHKLESANGLESEMKFAPRALEVSEEHVANEIDKRANMHQFFGVRGKKSIQNKRPYDLTFRGKFIGVRGKKDAKNYGAQELKFLLDQNAPWPKRKTQMGFFGMRGKKWTEESSPETETTASN